MHAEDMATVAPVALHRLTVEQYHAMGAAGILAEDCRVELIDGALVDMAPIACRHASVVLLLTMRLARFGELAIVSTQNAVTLPPYSEPQPDIALLAPRQDWYRHALPQARDVLLVIEVADTTLRYDRRVKLLGWRLL